MSSVAIDDEILEISGEEISRIWADGPGPEELMERLQERLHRSPDHITVKVLQEDGLINSYRMLCAPLVIPGIQHRRDGETGVELAKSSRHIFISKIRDGTPAFYSSLLAPGQRVISINHQRARLEFLEEYQNLDVGRVGYRITYVVDMRTEYLDVDEDEEEETDEQRSVREDAEWEEMMERGKPVMVPLIRQVAITNEQNKHMQEYRDSNSAFFLSAGSSGPDILPLKKPIIPTKPPKKRPPRPQPKQIPPPVLPKKPPQLPRPPKREMPAQKKPRSPPPKIPPPSALQDLHHQRKFPLLLQSPSSWELV